jgi:hypothetical protein
VSASTSDLQPLFPLAHLLKDLLAAGPPNHLLPNPSRKLGEQACRRGQMLIRLIHLAEMSQVEPGKSPGAHPLKTALPCLQIELGWDGGHLDMCLARHPDSSGVAGESHVAEAIGHVVSGVPWGVQGLEGQPARLNQIPIVQRMNLLRGDREDFSPQTLHPISIDALGARKELGRVDEMGRADVMDMNPCPLLGPPTGRTRVIEVDMGHEDMVHISRRDAVA